MYLCKKGVGWGFDANEYLRNFYSIFDTCFIREDKPILSSSSRLTPRALVLLLTKDMFSSIPVNPPNRMGGTRNPTFSEVEIRVLLEEVNKNPTFDFSKTDEKTTHECEKDNSVNTTRRIRTYIGFLEKKN